MSPADRIRDAVETSAALLTPPGRGAVASVIVEGPDAVALVQRLFFPAGQDKLTVGAIRFGRWGSRQGEEIVVCRRSEFRVEVHCHGGHAASEAILSSLEQQGCRRALWPAGPEQPVALQPAERLAAAARVALASASTERTARILLAQYNGALCSEFVAIAECLVAQKNSEAARRLRILLERAEVGRHLVQPWRVVLAGPPNVGKSSLINALVGYSRAIVYDQPGTTRDVVTANAAFEGWPVELSDTAGLRSSDEPLERAGVELTREQLARADLVLLAFDATAEWTAEHEALALAWPQAMIVLNKCDLLDRSQQRRQPPLSARQNREIDTLLTSALTGDGISLLESSIVRSLVPNPPMIGEPVPFADDQVAVLQGMLAALDRHEPAAALGIWQAWAGGPDNP